MYKGLGVSRKEVKEEVDIMNTIVLEQSYADYVHGYLNFNLDTLELREGSSILLDVHASLSKNPLLYKYPLEIPIIEIKEIWSFYAKIESYEDDLNTFLGKIAYYVKYNEVEYLIEGLKNPMVEIYGNLPYIYDYDDSKATEVVFDSKKVYTDPSILGEVNLEDLCFYKDIKLQLTDIELWLGYDKNFSLVFDSELGGFTYVNGKHVAVLPFHIGDVIKGEINNKLFSDFYQEGVFAYEVAKKTNQSSKVKGIIKVPVSSLFSNSDAYASSFCYSRSEEKLYVVEIDYSLNTNLLYTYTEDGTKELINLSEYIPSAFELKDISIVNEKGFLHDGSNTIYVFDMANISTMTELNIPNTSSLLGVEYFNGIYFIQAQGGIYKTTDLIVFELLNLPGSNANISFKIDMAGSKYVVYPVLNINPAYIYYSSDLAVWNETPILSGSFFFGEKTSSVHSISKDNVLLIPTYNRTNETYGVAIVQDNEPSTIIEMEGFDTVGSIRNTDFTFIRNGLVHKIDTLNLKTIPIAHEPINTYSKYDSLLIGIVFTSSKVLLSPIFGKKITELSNIGGGIEIESDGIEVEGVAVAISEIPNQKEVIEITTATTIEELNDRIDLLMKALGNHLALTERVN